MRDSKGRFTSGNSEAAAGGRARAAKLSKRRRRAIARKGYRAMVRKHFLGDYRAQRAYWGALGVWNSERIFIGTPVPVRATDPGKPQDFLSHYWQLDLMRGEHRDVEFMTHVQPIGAARL